jgi:secretion/DNA translocation related TadE-like protein
MRLGRLGSVDESGSAGLLTLAACLLVLAGGYVISVGANIAAVHAQVDAAADLTALAVAGMLLEDDSPCDRGRQIAEANGAQLHECEIEGLSATVTVAGDLPSALSRLVGRQQSISAATAELPASPRQISELGK